jgi:signal transduction histidine kinase
MSWRHWRTAILVALLSGVYWGAAALGLRLATVGSSVTLVWPPSGLALAALLLGGIRLWPGVLLGAFVANATTPGVPIAVAAAIATGNTLEAVLGAWLLRRARFDSAMARIRDVLLLVFLGAAASTLASATVGLLSLWGGTLLAPAGFARAFRTWWIGDGIGDLIFAAPLLAWGAAPRPRPTLARAAEATLLFTALTVTALYSFDVLPHVAWAVQPYALFPLLIWAALRFGPRGVATANLVVSAIAVVSTAQGHGPFARESLGQSLLLLQTFTGIVVLTSLVLGAAVAERDSAIARREDFMSIASHELNTPLTPLKLNLQRLRRLVARLQAGDETGDETAGLDRAMAVMERQTDRLTRLVTDLLDVTRRRSGRYSIELEDVDLAALVAETVEGCRDELALAGCALELRVVDPGCVDGRWDRSKLQQVVSNLLHNAMKFGAGKPIEIEVRADGRWARMVMRDHGVGIEREAHDRIFGRFQRGASSRGLPGMGLGLYIVRQIVETHGGSIVLDSRPGEGATFTVSLPRRPSRRHRTA